ncbi:hypothetical protein MRB53_038195 [Persea americana]|nr:hypothetical protein MRB53_038195 [Persea americana]
MPLSLCASKFGDASSTAGPTSVSLMISSWSASFNSVARACNLFSKSLTGICLPARHDSGSLKRSGLAIIGLLSASAMRRAELGGTLRGCEGLCQDAPLQP